MTVTIRAFTEDSDGNETAWDVECSVTFGRAGSYHNPPETDDVEVLSATAEGTKIDGDDFLKTYTDQVSRVDLEERAIEAAGDALYERMAERADYEREERA